MTRKKRPEERRRPGRPRKDSAAPAARALPPVVQVVSAETSTDDALTALAIAERSDDSADAEPSAGRIAGEDVAASFPEHRDGANGNGTKPAPVRPKGVSLTGQRFANLTNAQLQTALAIAHNELAQLREEIKIALPAQAATKAVALERMTSVFCSALFDITALVMKVDEIRLDREQEKELGELGAPAIEPYLGEYGKHAPLLAFGGKLASVITEKVITVRILKDAAAKASGDTRRPEAGSTGGGAE